MQAKQDKAKLFEMSALNRKLRNVMLQDTRFLQRHGFLDYSLLLAVEKSTSTFDPKKALDEKRLTRGLIRRGAVCSVSQITLKSSNLLSNQSKLLSVSGIQQRREVTTNFVVNTRHGSSVESTPNTFDGPAQPLEPQ